MSWWKSITGAVLEPVGKWATAREERKALESQMASQERVKMHELKMAQYDRQIELKKSGLEADAAWEMEFARQAASSWKDEYTLIVISIPAIGCFIPGMDVVVARGFEALSRTPLWYQGVFISLFLATVGIRYYRRQQSDT
jgi:hypothetical protein